MLMTALVLVAGIAGGPATGRSSELEMLAYELGSSLGTAIYCGEPSALAFGRMAGDRLQAGAPDAMQWSRAVRVLADAAAVRAEHGPITQTCGEFHVRYSLTLDRLIRGRSPRWRSADMR